MLGEERLQSLAIAFEIFPAAEGNENRQNTLSCGSDHRAFGIARCASMRAEFIGEERQAFEVQVVFADALVRFPCTSSAKGDVSLHAREIVQADRQAAFDANNINDVHDSVNAWQSFAGSDPAEQSFRRAAIACGILSKRFVACARRKNGRGLEDRARIGKRENCLLRNSQQFLQRRRSLLCCHFCRNATESGARTLCLQSRVYSDNLHETFPKERQQCIEREGKRIHEGFHSIWPVPLLTSSLRRVRVSDTVKLWRTC